MDGATGHRAPPAGEAHDRGQLRFLTCGSVDDGKSTFLGRLLYDSQLVFDDHLAALERDSRQRGASDGELDFSLLLDGLEAEREQGITIDVAYKFFATARRAFIVADTPGHEQYTRNMVSGASHSDLAVLLVDARKGVLVQTRRHSTICSVLGIRHIVLAVNKIDLVEDAEAVFQRIADDYRKFATLLDFLSIVPIPISARFGDNVAHRSRRTAWYSGPTVLEYLESVEIEGDPSSRPFRFPVQWVNRASSDFRGLAGTVSSGRIAPNASIRIAGARRAGRISRIVTADGDRDSASAGDAVTLILSEDLDVSRGCLISTPEHPPEYVDQFAAKIIWTSDEPLLPGRSYLLRIGNQWTSAWVTAIKHKLDWDLLKMLAGRTLNANEIGYCNISTSGSVAFDPYSENRETGSFIMVDRETHETVGVGLVAFALRRASNIQREPLASDKDTRAHMKGQRPCVVWFTGLSGAGKSTIARLVEARLIAEGRHTYMLDGDNIRQGLSGDLGFTTADRVENIRRVGEVARLFVDAGLIVLCAFISPFRAERRMVRDLMDEDEFIEVWVDTSFEECMRRDRKGLYAKLNEGKISNFTGFDSPYQHPEAPELVLATAQATASELADQVIALLRSRGRLF